MGTHLGTFVPFPAFLPHAARGTLRKERSGGALWGECGVLWAEPGHPGHGWSLTLLPGGPGAPGSPEAPGGPCGEKGSLGWCRLAPTGCQ